MADLKAQDPVQIDLAIMVSNNAWLLRRARALVAGFADKPDDEVQAVFIKQNPHPRFARPSRSAY